MASSEAALFYHEPDIVTILILSSFLILANALNWALDRLLYCGLLGQIAIGIAWGTPGANWLSEDVQNTVMQAGYLGLILLVMEGGLSTNLKTLKSNLPLSCLVALIGVATPIGLSFVLLGLVDGTTPVQAFAAGAALCSTSLGTTFTILSTSGLNASRLGVVLSSAAMLDDIVGLVMSGIISRLGQTYGETFSASTVIRPVFVSIAFAVVLPLVCAFFVKPVTKWCYKGLAKNQHSSVHRLVTTEYAAIMLQILVLVALVAAASYAGTSVLFAAYLAGAAISWWNGMCDDLRLDESLRSRKSRQVDAVGVSQPAQDEGSSDTETRKHGKQTHVSGESSGAAVEGCAPESPAHSVHAFADYDHLSGTRIFEKYFEPALRTILKPFFFASIGFAIPITRMFTGIIIWRGLVYTVLMVLAKLACGLCSIRFTMPLVPTGIFTNLLPTRICGHAFWPIRTKPKKSTETVREGSLQANTTPGTSTPTPSKQKPKISKPTSLYPATMLGSAMVARGEIGFLISSVAESNGVFGSAVRGGSSELYLIVTWAILLCTLIGPVTVGSMAKRVKRLQAEERNNAAGKSDPLGIWGMQGEIASHTHQHQQEDRS